MTAILAIVMTVLVAACTPADSMVPPDQPTPSTFPGASDVPLVGDGAVEYAIDDLGTRFGYDAAEITLESIEAVEWPDSALGCPPVEGESEPGPVPGYRIVLTAGDQTYEYHGAAGDSEPLPCP
jgi:hypothetical protein